MPTQTEAVKGLEITIIDGKYKGHEGWMNNAMKQPAKMRYVIINIDGEEVPKRISRKSIGPRVVAPASFEEAAFQQIPEVRFHMIQAALHLAKCGIEDWDEAARMFIALGIAAKGEMEALGPKAAYYNIDYAGDDSNT